MPLGEWGHVGEPPSRPGSRTGMRLGRILTTSLAVILAAGACSSGPGARPVHSPIPSNVGDRAHRKFAEVERPRREGVGAWAEGVADGSVEPGSMFL